MRRALEALLDWLALRAPAGGGSPFEWQRVMRATQKQLHFCRTMAPIRLLGGLLLFLRTATTLVTTPSEGQAGVRFIALVRAHSAEPTFLSGWVEWYLALGFDRLIVLDTNALGRSRLLLREPSAPERVQIVPCPDKGDATFPYVSRYLTLLPGAEWVLVCDVDEYLLLDRPTIAQYVHAIEAQYGHAIDVFQFRWASARHVEPWCWAGPLRELVRRISATEHVVTKSMTRLSAIKRVTSNPHQMLLTEGQHLTYTDGYLRNVMPGPHFFALPTYKDAALVHISTRSIADLFAKSVATRFKDRAMRADHATLATMIRAPNVRNSTRMLHQLVVRIGDRIASPLWEETVLARRMRLQHSLSADTMGKRLKRLRFPLRAGAAGLELPFCNRTAERDFVGGLLLAKLGVSLREFERFAVSASEAMLEALADWRQTAAYLARIGYARSYGQYHWSSPAFCGAYFRAVSNDPAACREAAGAAPGAREAAAGGKLDFAHLRASQQTARMSHRPPYVTMLQNKPP
jgi:hypothetical protein